MSSCLCHYVSFMSLFCVVDTGGMKRQSKVLQLRDLAVLLLCHV